MLNNVTLDKSLQNLINSKTLKKEGKFYYINFENEYKEGIMSLIIKEYKKAREVPFKVYLILIDLVEEIGKHKDAEAYLFGSYAKLIYKENSDIDLALINNKLNQKFLSKIEKKYNYKIELHYFRKDEFYKNKNDPLIKDIMKNGVKLI